MDIEQGSLPHTHLAPFHPADLQDPRLEQKITGIYSALRDVADNKGSMTLVVGTLIAAEDHNNGRLLTINGASVRPFLTFTLVRKNDTIRHMRHIRMKHNERTAQISTIIKRALTHGYSVFFTPEKFITHQPEEKKEATDTGLSAIIPED